jgi:hypothetical protein
MKTCKRPWKTAILQSFNPAIRLGLFLPPRYRDGNYFDQRHFVMTLVQAGISIFGLFSMDPALFAFALVAIVFGGLNILEFKRFD